MTTAMLLVCAAGCAGVPSAGVSDSAIERRFAPAADIADAGSTSAVGVRHPVSVNGETRQEQLRNRGWRDLGSIDALSRALDATLDIPQVILGGEVVGVMQAPSQPGIIDAVVIYPHDVLLVTTVVESADQALQSVRGELVARPGFEPYSRQSKIRGALAVANEAVSIEPALESEGSLLEGTGVRVSATSLVWSHERVIYRLVKPSGSVDDLVRVAEAMMDSASH